MMGETNGGMHMQNPDHSRMRPHPESRFSGVAHLVDLSEVAHRLRGESNTGERGHRQETCFKQGNLTVALFVFERFTQLPEHAVKGVVALHLLKGFVIVTVEGARHELKPGQILSMASGARHMVKAEEESDVLVTVSPES